MRVPVSKFRDNRGRDLFFERIFPLIEEISPTGREPGVPGVAVQQGILDLDAAWASQTRMVEGPVRVTSMPTTCRSSNENATPLGANAWFFSAVASHMREPVAVSKTRIAWSNPDGQKP